MDFFGDLGRKFSQAARSVTERTKEGVESTKLAVDLRAARSELETRLAELGRAYYDSIAPEGGEVNPELIQRVREAIALVENLTAQRERANRMSRCASCGSAQSPEANYCSNCGRPMPDSAPAMEETVEEDVQYCESCGAMRQGESKFCAVCGEAFGKTDENPSSVIAAPKPEQPEPLEEPEDTEAE